MSNTVLKPINPDPDQRIYLICNSSNIGLSGWIGQMHDDGIIRPGRFHSKKFNNTQMKYGITRKELLAIVDSVRNFRGVLQGHPVTILTDYQPLIPFMSSLQTNQMIIRWQESLSQLDINIEHIDGKKNVIADALSRTYKESPCPPSEQSPLSADHSNSTLVLPTITPQHLTVNVPMSTTLPFTTTMPSQPTPRRRMSNMSSRYETTDKYDPDDWELKINSESDGNRRVRAPTQRLRSGAAAARRYPNTITTEQVNQILQSETDRRWTEFHDRMLRQEPQEAANTLREEAAEALIALCQAATPTATTTAITTATTTRAQARA